MLSTMTWLKTSRITLIVLVEQVNISNFFSYICFFHFISTVKLDQIGRQFGNVALHTWCTPGAHPSAHLVHTW